MHSVLVPNITDFSCLTKSFDQIGFQCVAMNQLYLEGLAKFLQEGGPRMREGAIPCFIVFIFFDFIENTR